MAGLPSTTRAAIAASPTLFDGLRGFCEHSCRVSSRVSLWLLESEEDLLFCHRGSLPRNVPGQVENAWWALGAMVAVVRQFLGPRWVPTRMGVPLQGKAGPVAREFFPNTRLVPESRHAWIAVSRRLLASPLQPTVRQPWRESIEKDDPVDDFLGEFRLLLRSYLPDGAPDVQTVAEMAGISVRTLQRRLAAHGRTYARLVQESRIELARELLQRPESKVIDVAYEVGYTDPSHFARAFRRTAGITPREFRRNIAAADR